MENRLLVAFIGRRLPFVRRRNRPPFRSPCPPFRSPCPLSGFHVRCPSVISPVLPRFRTIRLSAVFCRFSPLFTASHLLLSRYLRHLPDCRPDTGTTSASDSGRRWCSCMKKRFPLTGGNRSLSRENVYSSAASGRIMTLTMLPSSRIFLARACTSALVVVRTASSWSAR